MESASYCTIKYYKSLDNHIRSSLVFPGTSTKPNNSKHQ